MKVNGHIDTTIKGIPCQILITSHTYQKPLGPKADSAADCYGYSDSEYTVLDRKGYKAEWLAKKIDKNTDELICELIDEYKAAEREEDRAYSRHLSREEY